MAAKQRKPVCWYRFGKGARFVRAESDSAKCCRRKGCLQRQDRRESRKVRDGEAAGRETVRGAKPGTDQARRRRASTIARDFRSSYAGAAVEWQISCSAGWSDIRLEFR